MTKIKNFAGEDWVLETIVKHTIEIFEGQYKQKLIAQENEDKKQFIAILQSKSWFLENICNKYQTNSCLC